MKFLFYKRVSPNAKTLKRRQMLQSVEKYLDDQGHIGL